MKKYKKMMLLNYLYEFIISSNITQLLWPTFLIIRGFSLIDVGIAESVFHITSMLCEVPTGIISDLYGRRFSRILGRILSIIEISILLFATNKFLIYLSFCICALSYNMESGTDTAYVYDLMIENKDESRFSKVQGYREVVIQSASFIGVFIGGIIALKSYSLAFVISICLTIFAIIILCNMKEIKNINYQKTNILNDMKQQYISCITLFKANHQIFYLSICYSIFSASVTTVQYFLTNYYVEIGINISNTSFFLGLSKLASILAGLIAYKIISRYNKKTIILFCPLIMVIALVGIPYFPLSVVSMIVLCFIDSILYVSITTFLNRLIPSETRTTLLSCLSMFFSIMMIIYFPLVGLIGDVLSLKYAFISLSLLLILIYMIYCNLIRKYF